MALVTPLTACLCFVYKPSLLASCKRVLFFVVKVYAIYIKLSIREPVVREVGVAVPMPLTASLAFALLVRTFRGQSENTR